MGTGFSGLGHEETGPGQWKAGLEDIPERCVALILGYLDPPEICKSATLNKAFNRASSADFVWESKLPENYQFLLNKLESSSTTTGSSSNSRKKLINKDIYAILSAPNRLGADYTKVVWLEKKKGGICVSISWKGMKITGIDDRRHWNHFSSDESRFKTIAYLQQTWWLEVSGELDFEFPAGTYSVFFRLQLGNAPKGLERRGSSSTSKTVHGWDVKPVHFQLSTSNDGTPTSRYCYLTKHSKWVHYHVGDFVVQNSNVPTKIKFLMSQIDCTHTKGGLCLDCVFICPTEIGHKLLKS